MYCIRFGHLPANWWASGFEAKALVRFDQEKEAVDVFTLPSRGATVRQLLRQPCEMWGAESGMDKTRSDTNPSY